jgi:hypothetical protein
MGATAPRLVSLVRDLSSIAAESTCSCQEHNNSKNCNKLQLLSEGRTTLLRIMEFSHTHGLSLGDECLQKWAGESARDIGTCYAAFNSGWFFHGDKFYTGGEEALELSEVSMFALLGKLVELLAASDIDALESSQIPILAKLLFNQKAILPHAEPVLYKILARVLRPFTQSAGVHVPEHQQSWSPAPQSRSVERHANAERLLCTVAQEVFSQPSAADLSNESHNTLLLLAQISIRLLNVHEPAPKPEPTRAFPTALCADLPQVQSFLRGHEYCMILVCSSKEDAEITVRDHFCAKSMAFGHYDVATTVRQDTTGGFEIFIRKRFVRQADMDWEERENNRDIVHKLMEAFPWLHPTRMALQAASTIFGTQLSQSPLTFGVHPLQMPTTFSQPPLTQMFATCHHAPPGAAMHQPSTFGMHPLQMPTMLSQQPLTQMYAPSGAAMHHSSLPMYHTHPHIPTPHTQWSPQQTHPIFQHAQIPTTWGPTQQNFDQCHVHPMYSDYQAQPVPAQAAHVLPYRQMPLHVPTTLEVDEWPTAKKRRI